jgi:hypothetical protein
MWVLMFEARAREQHAGIDQRFDHRFVGITLFAFVGEHALAGEARRLIGEASVGIDSVRDMRVDALRCEFRGIGRPHVEVLAAVSGRSVHEAGAGIVGDVIAGQERHFESVARIELRERMRADDLGNIVGLDLAQPLIGGDARLAQHVERKFVGKNK